MDKTRYDEARAGQDAARVEDFKEWLDGYQGEAAEIVERRERLAMMRTWQTKITPTLTGMPRPPTTVNRGLENRFDSVDRAAQSLQRAVEVHKQTEAAISAVFDRLDSPKHQKIMRLRYLDFMEWREIVAEIYKDRPDYSEKQAAYTRRVYRDHERAMKLSAREWWEIHNWP